MFGNALHKGHAAGFKKKDICSGNSLEVEVEKIEKSNF